MPDCRIARAMPRVARLDRETSGEGRGESDVCARVHDKRVHRGLMPLAIGRTSGSVAGMVSLLELDDVRDGHVNEPAQLSPLAVINSRTHHLSIANAHSET